jgi:hypothetical protein
VEGSKSISDQRTTDKEEGGARARTLENHRLARWRGARALAARESPTRRRGSKSTGAREPPTGKVEGARALAVKEPPIRRGEQEHGRLENHRQGGREQEH